MRTFTFLLSLGFGLSISACGDDSGGQSKKDAGDDGGAGPIMSTPKDASTDPMSTDFECGATQCTLPTLDPDEVKRLAESLTAGMDGGPLAGLTSLITPETLEMFGAGTEMCCVDETECGVTSSMVLGGECLEQSQAGDLSAMCPEVELEISVMGFTLPFILEGCCRTDDDLCGLDFGLLGVGCVELTEAAGIDTMGAAMVVTDAGGQSISCGSGAGNDGGADDGG